MVFYDANDENSVLEVKDIIDNKLNCKLKRTREFSLFDLRDNKNKIIVEVKERKNIINKYPTTMIGENKFIKAKDYFDRGYKVLFVFKFTDGIYYYEYCDEKLKIDIGGRCDRGRPEYKNYVYIDINKLKSL
jgi:hypothetical protein